MNQPAPKLIDELGDDELVIQRFEVEAFDPWRLLGAAPRHKSFRVFNRPDGPVQIGLGSAARVASRPGKKGGDWRQLYNSLTASLGPLGPLATVFFTAAFDRQQPFDAAWEGYVPVELCVPDIVWKADGDTYTMTIVASKATFERTHKSGMAALTAARGEVEPAPISIDSVTYGDEAYASAVRGALSRIADGVADKIVVARAIEAIAQEPIDVPVLMAALAERFPRCFHFAYRPGGSHKGAAPTFLGATPERLVAVENGVAHTGAIAGTAPRGVSARMDERHAQALLTSDKEMREHDVVGEMIVDALRPLCERVERDTVRFLKLANVQHLWTPIRGQLQPGAGILDVAQALHPTPAVGGQPRESAVAAIRELETRRRGLYAGVLGTIDTDGGGDLAVAIRSALVHGKQATVFAGAGIVAGSEPDREVQETRAKSRAILDCLGAP